MRKFKKIAIGFIVATMLFGASIASAATQSFKDVDSSFWGYTAIEWGVQQKITSGYDDGTFKPDKTVTEEEFITLLVRAYGGATLKENEQHWSDPYYRVALDHNLPVSSNRTATLTRQSVANIIVGTQGVNFTGDDAVQYMLAKGLTKGKTDATIEGYKGTDTLTRAEAIAFIKNVMDNVKSKAMLTSPKEPTPKSELPPLPTKVEEFMPVGKQIPLDSLIDSFNKAVKELGLSDDYILVKGAFTPNTSATDSTIYDYYAQSPVTGSVMNTFAFSVFYNAETGDFQEIRGTVRSDLSSDFMHCLFAAVYPDGEKAKQSYASNKIDEVIQTVISDHKTDAINIAIDDDFYFRFGLLGYYPQYENQKCLFSIHI